MFTHSERRSFDTVTMLMRGAVALILALSAVANLITAILSRPWQPAVIVQGYMDLDSLWWGPHGQIIIGLLLLLVARALVRGKRQAWWLAVGLLVFSLCSALLARGHLDYIIASVVALVLLLAVAPLFPARSDPAALRRGWIALGLSVICLVTLHEVYLRWPIELMTGLMRFNYNVSLLIRLLLRGLVFLFLGYGVIETLRPVLDARLLHRNEQALACHIVRRYGDATLAHFTLSDDMRYFWSETGQSFLAYRFSGGVAVVLGDPIGPDAEREDLLITFLQYANRQDWLVSIWQASARFSQLCRERNFHSYKMGEEALVAIPSFTVQGKKGAPVRHAIARARRDNISVSCWCGEAPPPAVFAGMKEITAAWLTQHKTYTQMGFSMGRFPADWSPDLLTVVALDQHDNVQAFLTWTPRYAANGWALDCMRRSKDTAPGVMEFLIAESIEWARARGYQTMSLGLAPLAGLGAGFDQPLTSTPSASTVSASPPTSEQRALARPTGSWLESSASFLHRRKLLLGAYTSLYAFKAKFQPTWEPRYLVVSHVAALPRIGAALLSVHGYSWLTILRDTSRSLRLPAHRPTTAAIPAPHTAPPQA